MGDSKLCTQKCLCYFCNVTIYTFICFYFSKLSCFTNGHREWYNFKLNEVARSHFVVQLRLMCLQLVCTADIRLTVSDFKNSQLTEIRKVT